MGAKDGAEVSADYQPSAKEIAASATAARKAHRAYKAYLRAGQHRLPGEYDRRFRSGRRTAALVKELQAELGIVSPTPVQQMAIERAACLQAIAEDTMLRKVGGDTAISNDDVLRADRAAERALRAIGIVATKPAKPTASLRERIIADEVSP
jgi:hypothetical protein